MRLFLSNGRDLVSYVELIPYFHIFFMCKHTHLVLQVGLVLLNQSQKRLLTLLERRKCVLGGRTCAHFNVSHCVSIVMLGLLPCEG